MTTFFTIVILMWQHNISIIERAPLHLPQLLLG